MKKLIIALKSGKTFEFPIDVKSIGGVIDNARHLYENIDDDIIADRGDYIISIFFIVDDYAVVYNTANDLYFKERATILDCRSSQLFQLGIEIDNKEYVSSVTILPNICIQYDNNINWFVDDDEPHANIQDALNEAIEELNREYFPDYDHEEFCKLEGKPFIKWMSVNANDGTHSIQDKVYLADMKTKAINLELIWPADDQED